MSQPAEWLCENFALEPGTVNNMRNLVIPRWEKEIAEFEEILPHLQDEDSKATRKDVEGWIAKIREHVEKARKRLEEYDNAAQ